MYVCMYIYINMYMCEWCRCVFLYRYIFVYIHTYIHTCIHTYIYIYICIYVYIFIYLYTCPSLYSSPIGYSLQFISIVNH